MFILSNVVKLPFVILKSPVVKSLVLSVPASIPSKSINKLLDVLLAL